ncbi:MAG: efflux RND transporter periplasmic adaptor subunit [Candidatus Hydrogenedentes bacterium]|nr:efflux RND transporter periplasmic adaptor subunit [Candidatus Hydrogenedentota bacterium]
MSSTNRNYMVVAAVSALLLCAGIEYTFGPKLYDAPLALAAEKEHAHEEGEKHEESGHDAHEESGHEEEKGEHGEHEEEGNVHLSSERMEELDITLSTVHQGSVKSILSFPAETMLDPDDEAHLIPRVPGIAREIFASIGDVVAAGDLLAILDSRELGRAKSEYLADLSMRDLLQATYIREKKLWEDKISAEQDYLIARQAYQAAQIEVKSSEQSLFALGLSVEDVKGLPREKGTDLTRYEVRAPFAATVIERHIALGEAIGENTEIFLIANLKTIWAMGRVTERDLRKVSLGQEALIQLEGYPGEEFPGKLDYIGSILDPNSRTVNARVILSNEDKRIRAGMFGRLLVFLDSHEHSETLLVPNGALQRTATGAIVYKEKGEGIFEPLTVDVLHTSDTLTEIQGALKENDRVAVGDIFVLKSEAGKAAMGGGHSH